MKLIIASLATWRLGNLVAHEDGPFDIFEWFRIKLGVNRDESTGLLYGENSFSRMVVCTMCNTVWIAMVTSFIMKPTTFFEWLVYVVAISALAIHIEEKR